MVYFEEMERRVLMTHVVEAIVHADGTIEAKAPIPGSGERRVLITVLDVPDEQLPTELEQTLATLTRSDDAHLWQVARSAMEPSAAERLAALNSKRQREGLSPAEEAESELLVAAYERSMLVRAQATALLKERGHDITSLFARP
jgi:hypothetical protein